MLPVLATLALKEGRSKPDLARDLVDAPAERFGDRGIDVVADAVTTDLTATPEDIIARYAARWSIEVTFFDVKNILGVGQARNRVTKDVDAPRGG